MYQVLIKNGEVMDPANNFRGVSDIAIDDGKISAVREDISGDALNLIDASNCVVTPGLIDHHAHLYPLAKIGIPAEALCFACGVTTVVDAGSTGCENFGDYVSFIERCKISVKAYLNVCSTGLDSLPAKMEDVDPSHYDEERIRKVFEEHGKFLLGLKLRTSKEIVRDLNYEPLKQTVKLADKLGLSVMIHCTNPPGEMSELLEYLRPGDVMTHMYMNKGSTILDETGHVSKAALDARNSGVIFEAADARAHFSFEVSEPAINEGFYPDIIATDLTRLSMHLRPTAFNMVNQLAKYNALGIPEAKIFAACTINPAKHMKISHMAGSLTQGYPADVAIFRREEHTAIFGDRPFTDNTARFHEGRIVYRPVMTIKNGEIVFRDITF